MQTLTLTVFMPDGSTKIFEDIQGLEQPSDTQVTFLCKGAGEGLRSVTINLNLTLGFRLTESVLHSMLKILKKTRNKYVITRCWS